MTPKFTTAADLFGTWFADVERGEPPVRFKLSEPFASIDVRPGRLLLFGGPPTSGKTAALMQMGIDLLRMNPSARLLVANVEMSPTLLLDRIVSRLSAVPLSAIADRTRTPEELARIRAAIAALQPVAGQLGFLDEPHSLEHVAAAGKQFGANVLMLDYIQNFTLGDGKGDKREQLEAAANVLRGWCNMGAAVLVASAIARQKSASGSTYRNAGLASFRGSSALEYSADSAYLVEKDENLVTLRCEKNRYGAASDVVTTFDGAVQTFAPMQTGFAAFDAAAPARNRTNGE